MKLIDVARQFGTPEACNDFLESMRWPDGPECVHCARKRVTKYTKKVSTRQRLNAKTGEMETKAVRLPRLQKTVFGNRGNNFQRYASQSGQMVHGRGYHGEREKRS